MTKKYIASVIFGLLFFVFNTPDSLADHCFDNLVLDGSETVVSYGLDTTRHWWALTSPFTNAYRLTVDGKQTADYLDITGLVFSPDGNRWACFARDNKQWYLVANDTVLPLPGTDPGEIEYSPNSEVICYSYKEAEQEVILLPGRKYRVYQRTGKFFMSWGGERFAFMGYRGDKVVININGTETPQFDEIKPLGFWNDGNFIYVARSGTVWEIYKGDKPITETFSDITEALINLDGTAAGAIVKTASGKFQGLVISDEYYEPLLTKTYDMASWLVLHPKIPMIGFLANLNSQPFVVLSSTEFHGGEENSRPRFTCDGSELFFLGCDIACFVNVSGRKYSINAQLALNVDYALKPGGETIAYTTTAGLVVRSLVNNELYSGRMVDEVSPPRYNWRDGRYEALGKINQRLYLLFCYF